MTKREENHEFRNRDIGDCDLPCTTSQYDDAIIRNGMEGYLVLASCSMDDFPVALVSSCELAVAIADGMVAEVPNYIQTIFGIAASELVCFKVLFFQLGKPSAILHVRDLL